MNRASKLGRPRQVEDDAVFLAMADVLLRVGWVGLSVNLVAGELGVTPAALRQRFDGKQGLLAAFQAWYTKQLDLTLSSALDPGKPPLAALRDLIRVSVGAASTPTQVLNAMSVFTELGDSTELRRLTGQQFTIAIDRMTALLARASADGEIAGIGPAELAYQLHCCLLGVSLAWSVTDHAEKRGIEDEVLRATDLMLAPYLRNSER